jgi:hypothetical protein
MHVLRHRVTSGHNIKSGGTYGLQNYTYHPDTGNLASNANVGYTYGDSAHKHAVTSTSNGNSISFDTGYPSLCSGQALDITALSTSIES